MTYTDIIADLALELVASAFGRGQTDAGPDDIDVTREARAINAMRRGDVRAMERSLRAFRKIRAREWAALEKLYGKKP